MKTQVWRSVVCTIALSIFSWSANTYAGIAAQVNRLTFVDSSLGGYSLPYNLYLPADYDPNGPALPVILYLHGAGERGTNNRYQMSNALPMIDATQGATGNYRAIIVAPQCPNGQVWNSINNGDNWVPGGGGNSYYSETPAQQSNRPISNALQAAIDLVRTIQSTKNGDSNRLYVTGISMGGFGTWDAITRFPNLFAAAMPLSGGGNVLAADILKNKPIWAYHGGTDTVVFTNGSQAVIDAIRDSGGTQSIYSEQGGTGHSGWNVFYTPHSSTASTSDVAYWGYAVGDSRTTGGESLYSGDNVYDWLFAQSLSTPEPASLSLLIIGSFGLLARRQKSC